MPKFRFRGESQTLDAQARASAPGQFVKLPDGIVHYELAGPADAPTVVLVHGLSVPYYIWDPTFDALVEARFRVLRYDLYGRGYSDRPDAVCGQDLFDRQLFNLLSTLGIGGPVDLIGLSMGGAIAVVFTDRHSERVRKLCLIDPAGFPLKQPFAAKLVRTPILGEVMLSLFGDKFLISGLDSDLDRPEKFPQYRERYLAQMRFEGFKRALLSTLRSGILSGTGKAYARVGKQGCPVLLIWGREDQVIPFSASARVRAAIPHVEFHPIDQAGHIPHYERPEVVNPLLIEFLKR